MINQIRLLAMLNIIDCDCQKCMWERAHDIGDAIESGNAVFNADGDQVIALHATRAGIDLMKSFPMVDDATA
jgi:hypothetical protein